MSCEVEMVKPSLKDYGSETMPLTTNYGGLSSGMRVFVKGLRSGRVRGCPKCVRVFRWGILQYVLAPDHIVVVMGCGMSDHGRDEWCVIVVPEQTDVDDRTRLDLKMRKESDSGIGRIIEYRTEAGLVRVRWHADRQRPGSEISRAGSDVTGRRAVAAEVHQFQKAGDLAVTRLR